MTREQIIERAKQVQFSSNIRDYMDFVAEIAELDDIQSEELDEAAEEYKQGVIDTGSDYLSESDESLYYAEALKEAYKAGWLARDSQIPKLPDDVYEAAEMYEEERISDYGYRGEWSGAFKAGAKWAMEQGVTIDGCVTAIANERWLDIDDDRADEVLSRFHNDEKVIIQIRKKHE